MQRKNTLVLMTLILSAMIGGVYAVAWHPPACHWWDWWCSHTSTTTIPTTTTTIETTTTVETTTLETTTLNTTTTISPTTTIEENITTDENQSFGYGDSGGGIPCAVCAQDYARVFGGNLTIKFWNFWLSRIQILYPNGTVVTTDQTFINGQIVSVDGGINNWHSIPV